MTPAFQLLVQVVQLDVGEQRRQRSALRRSKLRCLKGLTDQDARPQVLSDQRQQPLVAHLPAHAGHQDIVLDRVEKFRQIQIDGAAVTFTDVGLYPPQCPVGRAFRSKAEARIRKPWIENRPQDLRDGLLDHPIHERGYSQQTLVALVRLRDQDPANQVTRRNWVSPRT